MNSAAAQAPSFAKPIRVAIDCAVPKRRKYLTEMLQGAGFAVVSDWNGAHVVLSDNDRRLPITVPTVVLGGASDSPGILPLNPTAEQIEAGLRAVVAGLVVRPTGYEPTEFGPQVEVDEHALLTPRETQVLDAIASGLTNKGVARQLGISLHTVKFHTESLFRKLGARTRTEAVARRKVLTISL
jgi:DNA-binding NarL/FixJ family response regulator